MKSWRSSPLARVQDLHFIDLAGSAQQAFAIMAVICAGIPLAVFGMSAPMEGIIR